MSDKKIPVLRIVNPFDVRERVAEELAWEPTKTLADYYPVNVMAGEFVISVSGRIVMPEDFSKTYLGPDDSLVLCPVPQGGGGGNKSMLRMVAMIAVASFAPWATSALFPGIAGLGASMITAGIMVAGGLLVNALLPIKPPKQNEGLEASPSYGVDGPKNTSEEGLAVPVCYGTFRHGGNLLASFVRNIDNAQWLYLLYNAGEGPIVGISDIQVNDQPIANFKDYETEIRLGTADQTPIPWFEDAVEPRNISQELTTDWREFTTQGQVDKIRLDFTFPNGLFFLDPGTGNTSSSKVSIEAQYRKVGDLTWQTFNSPNVLSYTAIPTWYPGYVPTGFEQLNGDVWQIFMGGGESGGMVTVGTNYWRPNFSGNMEVIDHTRSTLRRSMESVQLEQGQYEIRVRRTTPAQAQPSIIDRVFLTDLNEIILDDISYKHTALLGVKIRLSDQLQGLPKVTYLHHGRVVKQWNREASAWEFGPSATPAWISLDMMCNKRFGGGVPESRMDLEKLKTWAQHTDNNSLFFNGIFDQDMNLWDATQHVLRVGHAQWVPVGTRYSVAVEKPDTPVMMFSVANMIQGSFKNTWLPMADRANEVEVTYFDKTDGFKERTVRAYDASAIAAGRPPKSSGVKLFGVTDGQQAFFEAVLHLNLNKYILQTVEFDAPTEAIACTAGDLVYIQHDMPQWGDAGRVAAGSTNSVINLDREVTLEPGKQYKLLIHFDAVQRAAGSVTSVVGTSLVLTGFNGATNVKRIQVAGKDLKVMSVFSAGGGTYGVVVESAAGITNGAAYTLWDTDVLEERDVVNAPGPTTTLTAQSPFNTAPAQFQNWLFGPVGKVKKPFRVRAIQGTHEYQRTIVALEYNESVYSPSTDVIPTPNYSNIDTTVKHVMIDGVTEELVYTGNLLETKVTVHYYSNDEKYRRAQVWVSKNGGEFQQIPADATRASVISEEGAELIFRVVAMDTVGASAPTSSAPTVTHVVQGKLAPPVKPTGFIITKRPTDLLLKWDPSPDKDWDYFEVREGASWDNYRRIVVEDFRGTMHVDDLDQAGTYYYHLRSFDQGGRESEVATYELVVTAPTPVDNFLAIQTGPRIDLQWDAHLGTGIVGYEIREGTTWQTAFKIVEVDSTRYTIPAGATADRLFWIAAIAAPGIYGTPSFASASVASVPDRNTLATQDEGAAFFPNVKHFGDVISQDLTMQTGVARAEYLFEVDLLDTFRSQNTLFKNLNAVVDDQLTWADANFAWNSLGAGRTWTLPGDITGVNAQFQIARQTDLRDDEIEGWRLNGSPNAVTGATPSVSTAITYADARYGDGVRMGDFSSLAWNVAIPAEFKHLMWILPDAVDNVVYLTMAGAGGIYLKLGYTLTGNKFYLEDHIGRRVELPFDLAVNDRILAGIVQTAGTRKLLIGKLGGNGSSALEASQPWAPAGAFTSLALG